MLRQFLCSGFSRLLQGTIFCQPFLHTYLQAWFVGTSHGTCAPCSRDNSSWSETVSPGGQVACWSGFLELFTEWVGSRAYASLENCGLTWNLLCKIKDTLALTCVLARQIILNSNYIQICQKDVACGWYTLEAGRRPRRWACSGCLLVVRQTSLDLTWWFLCSALFSSIKHPRYCSRDRWRFRRCFCSWGACLCQPGVRGLRVVGSVSFWIICKAEALTVCAY